MSNTIKILGLEIRVGNSIKDLDKVDALILKTSKSVQKAKKDWLEYSKTLTSMKGHVSVLKMLTQLESAAKSSSSAMRALSNIKNETPPKPVVRPPAPAPAPAPAVPEQAPQATQVTADVTAEKQRIESIRELEAEIQTLSTIWDNLSQIERTKTAEGYAMTKQLKALGAELQTTKMAAGNFSGGVGELFSVLANNLTGSLGEVAQSGKTMIDNFKQMASEGLSLGNALGVITSAKKAYNAIVTLVYGSSIAFGRAILAETGTIKGVTAATRVWTAVKLLFAGGVSKASVALKVFGRAMMANPLMVVITLLTSAVALFAILRDRTNDAAKAQERYNEQNEQHKQQQSEKRQRTEELIQIIKTETETQIVKIKAYNELAQLSPALTSKYTQEQIATMDLAEATKFLNEQRDNEDYETLIANVAKHTEIVKKLRNQSIPNDKHIKAAEADLALAQKSLDEMTAIRAQAAEKLQPIEVRIKVAEDNVAKLKSEIDAQKNKFERHDWGIKISVPFVLSDQPTDQFSYQPSYLPSSKPKEQALEKAEKNLEALKNEQKATTDPKPTPPAWSLSSDKAYNAQVLQMKQQRLSGEIASDEEYQRRVLQLEIDTLNKRIGLNKDSAKELAKLNNDLIDKQIKQQDQQQNQTQAYANKRKANNELIAKEDSDKSQAEIDAMNEGAQKQLLMNDKSLEDAKKAADNALAVRLDALTQEQKLYESGLEQYNEIENQKNALITLNKDKIISLESEGQKSRLDIIKAATADEIKELSKLPQYYELITKAAIEDAEERKKIAQMGLDAADAKYLENEKIADATYGNNKNSGQRKTENLKNEVEKRRDQLQVYKDQLKSLEEKKAVDTPEYNDTVGKMGSVGKELKNLGGGLNADGSGGGLNGFIGRTLKVDPEEAEQIKQAAFEMAQEISDTVFEIAKKGSKRKLDNEKKMIDSEHKMQVKQLDDKLGRGLISEKAYQMEMERLEAEKAKKDEEAEREAFEREKKMSIAQVWINIAMGIAMAWATHASNLLTMPLAITQTAVLVAQGVMQTALIASQKFAQGGIIPVGDNMGVVKGRSHAQGGHQIYLDGQPIGEIEGDELIAIVNKYDTARIGALSEANSRHGRRFAQGGLVSAGALRTHGIGAPVGFAQLEQQQRDMVLRQQQTQQSSIFEALRADAQQQIEAINGRIDRLKVVLVTREVTDAQKETKKIEVRGRF